MLAAGTPSWRLVALVVLALSILLVGGMVALCRPVSEPFSSEEADDKIDVTRLMQNVCNKEIGLSAADSMRNGVQDCHLKLRHQIISDKVTLDSTMQVNGNVLLDNVDLRTHAKKVLDQDAQLTTVENKTRSMNVGPRDTPS